MKNFIRLNSILISFLLPLTLTNCSDHIAEKEKKVQQKISEWIKMNSAFPDSYRPDSFKDFEIVKPPSGEHYYRIFHLYQLKNIKGGNISNKHFFVISKDYKVSIVSNEKTSYRKSIPPSVFKWASDFGEQFKEVDFGGADSSIFYQAYQDYKNIEGDNWYFFDYLDKNCLDSLRIAIQNNDSENIDLVRIIKAFPQQPGDRQNEIIKEVNIVLEKTYHCNIAVLKNNEKEEYLFLTFNKESNALEFRAKQDSLQYSVKVDTAYLNNNCFRHRLKF